VHYITSNRNNDVRHHSDVVDDIYAYHCVFCDLKFNKLSDLLEHLGINDSARYDDVSHMCAHPRAQSIR
jgi:hypothetical protein